MRGRSGDRCDTFVERAQARLGKIFVQHRPDGGGEGGLVHLGHLHPGGQHRFAGLCIGGGLILLFALERLLTGDYRAPETTEVEG